MIFRIEINFRGENETYNFGRRKVTLIRALSRRRSKPGMLAIDCRHCQSAVRVHAIQLARTSCLFPRGNEDDDPRTTRSGIDLRSCMMRARRQFQGDPEPTEGDEDDSAAKTPSRNVVGQTFSSHEWRYSYIRFGSTLQPNLQGHYACRNPCACRASSSPASNRSDSTTVHLLIPRNEAWNAVA